MTIDEEIMTGRAQRIIDKMGGVEAVAQILGRSKSRVYSWTYPKARHGSGGLIPPDCQQRLLAYSRSHGGDLCPDDFFSAEAIATTAQHNRGAA